MHTSFDLVTKMEKIIYFHFFLSLFRRRVQSVQYGQIDDNIIFYLTSGNNRNFSVYLLKFLIFSTKIVSSVPAIQRASCHKTYLEYQYFSKYQVL